MTLTRFIVALCLFATIAACGTFYPNPKLENFDKSSGYRYSNLQPGPRNSDDLFVLLSFSGGGTRAAALSYGVMQTLRDTVIVWDGQEKSLLDEVDIISSVSGGSFTAGYYGLHREDLFDERFEDNFLKKNIQKELFYELFIPSNWFKLMGRSYGRSDLAADYYSKHIFSDQTYQALIDRNTRPFVMLNTTDMLLGTQFPMIQDQFDLICSDLSQLPIARAVASSSAFPGLLTPLTYQNHAAECDYLADEPLWTKLALGDRLINAERARRAAIRRSYYAPESVGQPGRSYLHLIDGGVSDNIGLRGPAWAFNSGDSPYSLQRMLNNEKIKTLMIIVVNAGTSPDSKLDRSSEVPSAFKVVEAAATRPMDNYSFDTVELLKGSLKKSKSNLQILHDCQAALEDKCPAANLDTSLYGYDAYVSEIAFEFIENPETRHYFQNIGTNFGLPVETVDQLIGVGCKILKQNSQFNEFMSLHGKKQPECGS